MQERPELSTAKRSLLEKSLQGKISIARTGTGAARSNGINVLAPGLAPTPAVSSTPSCASNEDNNTLRVPVVPIRSSGSKRPFFYSHVHVDGGAFYCFTLANSLGVDQPFYILEPYRFIDGEALPTLEAMATAYIESMRTVQPHGPYLLGGFCGGGLIVFEMAHQLRKQGEDVDLLLLIEAVDGPGPASYRMLLRTFAGRLTRRFSNTFCISSLQQLNWFLRLRHYYLLLRYPEYRKEHKPWFTPTQEMLHKDWIGIFVWLISDYRPNKYPGKVTYFWAEDEFIGRREWRGKQVEAVEREMIMIPGNHWSCRNDHHLQTFADKLNQTISEAQLQNSRDYLTKP